MSSNNKKDKSNKSDEWHKDVIRSIREKETKRREREKKLGTIKWRTTSKEDRLPHSGWSETAYNGYGYAYYTMYYDNSRNKVVLFDHYEHISYEVPQGSKAKGYDLAYRLVNLNHRKKVR